MILNVTGAVIGISTDSEFFSGNKLEEFIESLSVLASVVGIDVHKVRRHPSCLRIISLLPPIVLSHHCERGLLQFSEVGRNKKADCEKCPKHVCLKSFGGNEYCLGIEGTI